MELSIGKPYLFCLGLPDMQTTLADRVKLALEGPPKRSQVALAKACGIHPVSVNDWVHGRTQTIEGSNLINAAAFLGVSPKWLASGIGPMRDAGSDQMNTIVNKYRSQNEASARDLITALATMAMPLRPTLRKNLANLLVELVEHPEDTALFEQTITDVERFFNPTA